MSHSKILPFRYQHLGGFEYVGYNSTHGITERGSKGNNILDGFGAWWLWRSIFTSNLISRNMKLQMISKALLSHFNKANRKGSHDDRQQLVF